MEIVYTIIIKFRRLEARKLSAVDSIRSEQAYLECEGLIRSSLQEVRLSVRAIRDEPIKSTSLHNSLKNLSEKFTKFAEVQTDFKADGIPVAITSDLQLTAFRIVQESLTNAQKHGHAKKAAISLSYSDTGFSLLKDMPSEAIISDIQTVYNGGTVLQNDIISMLLNELEFPLHLVRTERSRP